jgi:hypothetical protein
VLAILLILNLKTLNMKDFKKELDELYKFWQEMECPPETKIEFLGAIIFDFTTYDGEIDVLFAEKMVEVLECILNRTTFEYQEDKEKYINYLTMVNMPFLTNKLEWGTSIRGAWFDDYRQYEIDCGRLIVEKGELTEFIKQLIEWVRS